MCGYNSTTFAKQIFDKMIVMKNYLLIVVLFLFATASFAKEGYYLEFKMSGGMMSGTSKTWSADGNTRSEMSMKMAAMKDPLETGTLMLASTPNIVYTLNDQNKTYSEMQGGKADKTYDDEIEVTVIGKERVNNYNCVHVKVRFKKGQHETEMWLSKEIAGYANYTSIKNNYLGGSKFFDQLKAKGADGFVVRLLTAGGRGGEKMQMDLVKAEKREIEASRFSLSGYNKTAGTAIPGLGGKTVEELKAMTPEERQQYIKEMQQKYQQH